MENSIGEDMKYIHKTLNDMKIKDEDAFMSAVATIFRDYKRVLKENEQLRTEVNSLKKENEELKNDYENLSNSVVVKNHCIKNSIPVSLVKDKIEEIQEEGYWLFTTNRDSDKCVEVLQELLESEE